MPLACRSRQLLRPRHSWRLLRLRRPLPWLSEYASFSPANLRLREASTFRAASAFADLRYPSGVLRSLHFPCSLYLRRISANLRCPSVSVKPPLSVQPPLPPNLRYPSGAPPLLRHPPAPPYMMRCNREFHHSGLTTKAWQLSSSDLRDFKPHRLAAGSPVRCRRNRDIARMVVDGHLFSLRVKSSIYLDATRRRSVIAELYSSSPNGTGRSKMGGRR